MNLLKDIYKCIIIIILSGIIGIGLLCLVYALPTKYMEINVGNSIEMLEEQGSSYELINGITSTRLDNYTDSIMLNTAIYNDEQSSTLEKAVSGKRYEISGTPFDSLIEYFKGDKSYTFTSYERYWHGYLVVLKPLLIFFSYGRIKAINALLQLLLMIAVVYAMIKNGMEKYVIAFMLGILSLTPIAVMLCLQYSSVYYITLISMLVFIQKYAAWYEKKYFRLFYCFVGILTCYFDFLTYPIVSFGFLMMLQIIIERKQVKTILQQCKELAEYSIFWIGGYIGIWGFKWIIATVILRKNIIKDAILEVLYRSSSAVSDSGITEYITRSKALKVNLDIFGNNMYYILLVLFIVTWIVYINKRKLNLKNNSSVAIEIIAVMMIPFLWVLATANHSYVHVWMVHRIFSITYFALASLVISMTGDVAK
jgi:hypothetical protein